MPVNFSSPARRAGARCAYESRTVRPVHIIGVSLDLGGNRRGVDMGPSAFRIAGLGERLTALGMTVVDEGDLVAPIPEVKSAGDPQKKYIREIARVCERLYKTSLVGARTRAASRSCLAAITAWRRARWRRPPITPARPVQRIGAHLGRRPRRHEHARRVPAAATCMACRSPRCSGRSRRSSRGSAGSRRRCGPEHTVLIGIRNLDEREKEIVRDAGVHVFTMKDIDRSRHRQRRSNRRWSSPARGHQRIHVSFDLDVCDPAIAPGVGTPVKGGLDYREAHMVMEMIADSGLLRALDLVEVNPILDDRNMTADARRRARRLGARTEDSLKATPNFQLPTPKGSRSKQQGERQSKTLVGSLFAPVV